ncbi:MAG TPA: hypothetical protein VFR49_00045, partial [Solirubrobacteraceae bacterium]|nr:hypothetical protein [Solirubrobacteraceae bacterium]
MGRPARLGILLAVALLAAGLALAPGRTAGGMAPAASYDNPLRTSAIDRCVRPTRPAGIAAYAFDGARLPFTVATGHEPGTRPRCRAGELRILALAALTIDGQPAYVRRGGCAEPCRVRQPTVHVLARDLSGPVRLLAASARGGDGAPAPGCSRAARAAPARAGSDLGRMYYKTPAEIRGTHRRTGVIGPGARWSNYGDPGRRFHPRADYGYLLWNLPRRADGSLLPGGGIVEAVIAEGDPVALCAVAPLTLPSFDARGARNGAV